MNTDPTHNNRWWELNQVWRSPCWLYSGRVGLGDDRPGLRYVHREWQLIRVQRRAPDVHGRAEWTLVDGYLLASTEAVAEDDVLGAMQWAASELARLAFDAIETLTKQARHASIARAELVRENPRET